MRDVYISGAGMTNFGKFPQRGLRSLAAEAVSAALADAAIGPDSVGMVFFANAVGGLISGQEMIRGQVALQDTGLSGLPLINVENACASGASAVHLAWMTVASGQADVAVAIGAEKLAHPMKERTFAAIGTAVDVDDPPAAAAASLGGDAQPAKRSPFMDIYAATAEEYAERTDCRLEDFAQVAVKNHGHGVLNPRAQYGSLLSVEDVLASRAIAGPLTLLMCSPIGDGAAALVVTSADAVPSGQPTVRILASSIITGAPSQGQTPVTLAAGHAYELAGIGPDDVDVVEVHDATAPAELVIYEELGFADQGQGAALIRSGATALGGTIPVNPSGGLLSRGHPIGASGCAQLVELTDQLRNRAGRRQVDGAQIGLAQNAGGYLFGDVATAVVTVLAA